MKPLKTVQKLLKLLCLCTPDEDTSKWKKVAFITITCVLVSTQVFVCIESVAFLYNFMPKDFEHFLFAAAITLSRLSMLYIILVAILLAKEIPTIFSSLLELYEARKILIRSDWKFGTGTFLILGTKLTVTFNIDEYE